MRELLPAGDIVGVHGVKGVVKVRSRWSSESVFAAGSQVYIKDVQGRTAGYTIQWATPHKRLLLVCLEGLAKREAAEKLVGAQILTERPALPDTEEGEYYWFELIGLSVYTMEGRYLGKLEHILATGSNDVYVVRDGGRETLVPALESVVRQIDRNRKTMQVDLPEGL